MLPICISTQSGYCVLYIDVDVKVFTENDGEYDDINKSKKSNKRISLNMILKVNKEAGLFLVSDDISIEGNKAKKLK